MRRALLCLLQNLGRARAPSAPQFLRLCTHKSFIMDLCLLGQQLQVNTSDATPNFNGVSQKALGSLKSFRGGFGCKKLHRNGFNLEFETLQDSARQMSTDFMAPETQAKWLLQRQHLCRHSKQH